MENAEWYAAYVRDKRLADAVLRRLCLSAEIVGIRLPGFPNITTLEVGDNPYNKSESAVDLYTRQRPRGEVWIKIEGRWAVLASAPAPSLEQEQTAAQELPQEATDEQLRQLLTLREDRIVEIRLGAIAAHLIMRFASGRALFVSGDHRAYESWQLGLTPAQSVASENMWLLVDMPGGDIAIWTPDTFDPNFDASEHKQDT